MRTLRSFAKILDGQTVAVTGLALAATWMCLRYDFVAELPSALIGIAVIFPIVFSINSAYRRREEALSHLASAKAHAIAIAWAHRDWSAGDAERTGRGQALIERLFTALKEVFHAGPARSPEAVLEVYRVFSGLSRSHEALRAAGVTNSEVSRVNQYMRAVMIDFERLRNILDYRTPTALRAYSRIFLNSFPVLYGPYFAYLAVESTVAVGYVVALIYSLVLVSLDNIQEALEVPYGTVDEDDVDMDVTLHMRHILETTAEEG